MENKDIKILLLDDEQMIVDPMARHLKRRGYQPIKATSSHQALDAFVRECPDICILDIQLGVDSDKNGVDVLADIRKANLKIPCILLTVSSEEADTVKRGKALGAIHLEKPCDYEVWFSTIEEIAVNLKRGA